MRGILFDLDGTLLDIDLGSFLERYFIALRTAAAPLPVPHGIDVMDAIMEATRAMMVDHPGMTNQEAFDAEFGRRTGLDMRESWHVFERFYTEEFPALGEGMRPHEGAREVVEAARALGLKVAVATNPIFPRAAVDHRLAWAGLADLDIAVVTTYENMHASKPFPAYFTETAEMLGVAPKDCMMVGDDRTLDLPASAVGMRTFYVGPDADAPADFRGTLLDLTELLPRLVEEADEATPEAV